MNKEAINKIKHGFDFAEASTIFEDPQTIDNDDPDHSVYEPRFLATGLSDRNNLLTTWYSEPVENTIRIIGARGASPRERRIYLGLEQ